MNIHKITRYLLMLCAFTFLTLTAKGQDGEPLRLAVAGVSHGHLWEVISRLDRGDFKIVESPRKMITYGNITVCGISWILTYSMRTLARCWIRPIRRRSSYTSRSTTIFVW